MAIKYLVTGATGGLGKAVLQCFVENLPATDFAAASSRASNKAAFEERGIAFRHVNYDDATSLGTGLKDVENLLFISSNSSPRMHQHAALINAAKKANVKHIWYTSLAFGGLGNQARSAVQAEHLQTEEMLKESGLTYTSIREGIYAEAFPIFLDWLPDTTKLTLPGDGEVAYTLRAELGEATARIMALGGYENQIVLFTAKETINARQIVDLINETTDRKVELDIVSREEYLGGNPAKEFRATLWDDIVDGQLSATHPLMEQILGRVPTPPREAIRQLLTERRDYTYP